MRAREVERRLVVRVMGGEQRVAEKYTQSNKDRKYCEEIFIFPTLNNFAYKKINTPASTTAGQFGYALPHQLTSAAAPSCGW